MQKMVTPLWPDKIPPVTQLFSGGEAVLLPVCFQRAESLDAITIRSPYAATLSPSMQCPLPTPHCMFGRLSCFQYSRPPPHFVTVAAKRRRARVLLPKSSCYAPVLRTGRG